MCLSRVFLMSYGDGSHNLVLYLLFLMVSECGMCDHGMIVDLWLPDRRALAAYRYTTYRGTRSIKRNAGPRDLDGVVFRCHPPLGSRSGTDPRLLGTFVTLGRLAL